LATGASLPLQCDWQRCGAGDRGWRRTSQINATYFVALTPDETLGGSPVVTGAVAKLMGPHGRPLIAGLISLSILGSLTAIFLMGTPCVLALASDGLLSSRLG